MAHKQRKHDGGRSISWYRRQEYIILVTGIITMIIGLSLTILASLKISQFNEATAGAVGVGVPSVGFITLPDGSIVSAPETAGGAAPGAANFDSQTHCSCAVAEDPERSGGGGMVAGGAGGAGGVGSGGTTVQDSR